MGYGTRTTSITFSIEDIYGNANPTIPAGYVQVGFSVPKVGDLYLSKSGGTVKTMSASARAQLPKIIVKKGPVERTIKFKVLRYNDEPVGGEFGYNPVTGLLLSGSIIYSPWPEVLKLVQ